MTWTSEGYVVAAKRPTYGNSVMHVLVSLLLAVLFNIVLLSIAFRPPLRFRSTDQRRPKHSGPDQLFPWIVASSSSIGGGDDSGSDSYDNNNKNKNKSNTPEVKTVARLVEMSLSLIGSTTSAAVSLTFFGFLAWKRNALMVTFFIGSIGNGILSKLLKRIINQTRPVELASQSQLQRKPTDKGMPSSHAMSLGFIATFTALYVPWTVTPLVLYIWISLYYRIKFNLHTWQQVLVGLSLGSINGYVWNRLCQTTTLLDRVRATFLNEQGLLPVPMLIVPIVLGAMTVGSLERRLSDMIWWRSSSNNVSTMKSS